MFLCIKNFANEALNFERLLTERLSSSSLHSLTGKYREIQGNPCNENRDPAMRTGFPCNESGFSLWELIYREFPVSLTGFGFTVWTAQEGHWCSYRVLTKIRKIKLLLRTKNAVGPALTARKASLKVGRLPISGVGFSSQFFFLLRKL